MKMLRVLVVDDTIVYRKIVGDVLKAIPGVEVVGTANNGKIALSKINILKPDLISLDIEIPEMSGIEVLQELHKHPSPPKVIMLSTLTQQGSEMTIRALELGAFDFVPKPDAGKMAENMLKVKQAIEPIVSALKRQKATRINLRQKITPIKRAEQRQPPPPDTTVQRPRRTVVSGGGGIFICTYAGIKSIH